MNKKISNGLENQNCERPTPQHGVSIASNPALGSSQLKSKDNQANNQVTDANIPANLRKRNSMDKLNVSDDMPHRLNLSMGNGRPIENFKPLFFENPECRSEIMAQMNKLRRNAQFCDIILRVEGHELPVHRAVLACASPYLFDLFNESTNDRPAFKLHGVEYEPFLCLLDFAYTSRLEVPASSVKAVYKTALLLKMMKAAEACSRWLSTHLNPENCLGSRAFANSHSDSMLTSKTDEYIQENIQDVEMTNGFLRLPRIQVEIIGADENQLTANNEKHLCKLVVDWMRDRVDDEADPSLAMLCEHVHLLYLNSESNLQDCCDLSDDLTVGNEIISDYKKLTKKRHVVNLKGKPNGHHEHAQVNGSSVHIWMERTDSPQVWQKENKLIAIHKTGEHNFLCIAVLYDNLCAMSLHLRNEQPLNCSFEAGSDSEGNPVCRVSPSGSPVPLEKHASLTPLEPMGQPRCSVGAAVLDGNLIVLGGYDRGECLNSVVSYNLKANEWSQLTPMASARGRFEVSVINGKVYAPGGSNGQRELASVEVFDPSKNKWSFVAQLPSPRCHFGVTTLNDKLYMIGGWNGDKMKCLKRCDVYDPVKNQWSSVPSLQNGRSQPAVCSHNGRIYVFGGADAWSPSNTVEVYQPDTNSWRYSSSMTTNRRGAAACVYKGKIYVAGGSDGTQSLCSVEIFDMETESWSLGPTLTIPRANLGMVVIDGRLFAVGGFSGKNFLESIEYLDNYSASEWCTCVPIDSFL